MNVTNEYTDLEKKIFNALVDICMDDVESDVSDLSSETGLTKNTVKGVVGSLVKKGVVHVDKEQRDHRAFMTINPIVNGETLSFGCDQYDEEEIEEFKI